MIKPLIGCGLAFGIGAACRYFSIPCPAPSALMGAVLVLCMTLGYLSVDAMMSSPATPGGDGGASSVVPPSGDTAR